MSSVETILEQYQVDRAHARCVADHALTLFDGSQQLHNLSARSRELVEIGALLHNVGMNIDERKHHTVGRDVVLNTPIEGLDDNERAVVGCIVSFHRKKVHPQSESAFLRLNKKDQQRALKLAAIVRVADGLDYSQSQTTMIDSLELDGNELHMTLSGPHATSDGMRASEKANVWKKVFGAPLSVTAPDVEQLEPVAVLEDEVGAQDAPAGDAHVAGEQVTLATPEIRLDEAPWKLQPDDTLSEAARKQLRRYFQKLLAQERVVRGSEDPEGIHQMRVATRRLRATLHALGVAIDAQEAERFRRQIRAVARELGIVRDHDVFLEHIKAYSQREGAVPLDQLTALTDPLTKERNEAKERLLRKLDGRRYERFKRAFAHFVTSSDKANGATNGPPQLVRYAAGSAIWQAYEQLRAYETLVPADQPIVPDTDMTRIHEMRIAGKHFRYTLELFSEALGPHVDGVLQPLIDLQEHLGALQDIEVATAYVRSLEAPDGQNESLEQYIASRHDDHIRLLEALPARWSAVNSEAYRHQLMELIVAL